MKMRVQVYKNNRMADTSFVPGRFAMTCCVDDIRFIGPLCHAVSNTKEIIKKLKKREWIYLTAVVKQEYSPLYQGEVVLALLNRKTPVYLAGFLITVINNYTKNFHHLLISHLIYR